MGDGGSAVILDLTLPARFHLPCHTTVRVKLVVNLGGADHLIRLLRGEIAYGPLDLPDFASLVPAAELRGEVSRSQPAMSSLAGTLPPLSPGKHCRLAGTQIFTIFAFRVLITIFIWHDAEWWSCDQQAPGGDLPLAASFQLSRSISRDWRSVIRVFLLYYILFCHFFFGVFRSLWVG